MIEVKIDLVPFGIYSSTRQIGFIKIVNDATGNAEIGNYKYELRDDRDNIILSGEYKGFKRAGGIFLLLKEILDDCFGGKNHISG